MSAGNAKPNADRQRAPNNEINNSKFGMATANKTVDEFKIQRDKKFILNIPFRKINIYSFRTYMSPTLMLCALYIPRKFYYAVVPICVPHIHSM